MMFQVQIMLRKGGKGGAGVRSVQVASDSSLGEQLIMREEREIRSDQNRLGTRNSYLALVKHFYLLSNNGCLAPTGKMFINLCHSTL